MVYRRHAVIERTLALSLLFLLPAHAKDVGQWGSNVSPEPRAWFNGVYNRKGIECCEAADGYPVEYQMRSDNHYWVRVKGKWYEVPDEGRGSRRDQLGHNMRGSLPPGEKNPGTVG